MQNTIRRVVVWGLALMLWGSAWAQERKAVPGADGGGRPARAAGLKQVAQWRQSIDAGDEYPTPRGTRTLRRSVNRVAIRGTTARQRAERAAAVKRASAAWRDAKETAWGEGQVILTRVSVSDARGAKVPGRQGVFPLEPADTAELSARSGVRVDPVFVDPDSGLLMVMEPEILICLRDGVDPAAYFGESGDRVVGLPGTQDQFVLGVESMTAEDILAECALRSADARVVWAEPNFRSEGVRHTTPNDPLFADQWHLQDGVTGSVDAEIAWETSQGVGRIIAIVDDGVQSKIGRASCRERV